jgi:hypothetical protein
MNYRGASRPTVALYVLTEVPLLTRPHYLSDMAYPLPPSVVTCRNDRTLDLGPDTFSALG